MAKKLEPKGIVWGEKKESVWPAILGGVVGLIILIAIFGG